MPPIDATRAVAITGSSGLIGSALRERLAVAGARVLRLVRRPESAPDEVRWDPDNAVLDPARLEGLDAVIHLSGVGIADRRWSESRKRLLVSSRVGATRVLAESLCRLQHPPPVLVTASAIGIYGDCGDERVDESSPAGTGFLARLAQDWEAAAAPARARGIRVVPLRHGLVLSKSGGVLGRMLTSFRLGIGGPIGRPGAWWSWIAIDDVIGLMEHVLATPRLDGPVNAVAPNAVTNAQFARTLGRVLHRPAWLPIPAVALRLVFGEMADEAILSSIRVDPRRAFETGYAFRFPALPEALERVLGLTFGSSGT